MSVLVGKLRRSVFGISEREALFSRRGFPCRTAARDYLEKVGSTFILGYNAALARMSDAALTEDLNRSDPELSGFAFEGAAMAKALLDLLTPWNRTRLSTFLAGPGDRHYYMVHIGAGWALARLKRAVQGYLQSHHPVFRWLVMDGYGFHQGYFHWRRFIEERQPQPGLTGYAARAFDQGLGRALWFVRGADVDNVVASAMAFPERRRSDLFSGIGLAVTYAGKPSAAEMQRLRALAPGYLKEIAQGAAFGAKARQRAGNPTAHTELACQQLCGLSAVTAAEYTDRALADLPDDGDQPAFEIWRSRLRNMIPQEKTTT
jgi:hypothetical protein